MQSDEVCTLCTKQEEFDTAQALLQLQAPGQAQDQADQGQSPQPNVPAQQHHAAMQDTKSDRGDMMSNSGDCVNTRQPISGQLQPFAPGSSAQTPQQAVAAAAQHAAVAEVATDVPTAAPVARAPTNPVQQPRPSQPATQPAPAQPAAAAAATAQSTQARQQEKLFRAMPPELQQVTHYSCDNGCGFTFFTPCL